MTPRSLSGESPFLPPDEQARREAQILLAKKNILRWFTIVRELKHATDPLEINQKNLKLQTIEKDFPNNFKDELLSIFEDQVIQQSAKAEQEALNREEQETVFEKLSRLKESERRITSFLLRNEDEAVAEAMWDTMETLNQGDQRARFEGMRTHAIAEVAVFRFLSQLPEFKPEDIKFSDIKLSVRNQIHIIANQKEDLSRTIFPIKVEGVRSLKNDDFVSSLSKAIVFNPDPTKEFKRFTEGCNLFKQRWPIEQVTIVPTFIKMYEKIIPGKTKTIGVDNAVDLNTGEMDDKIRQGYETLWNKKLEKG